MKKELIKTVFGDSFSLFYVIMGLTLLAFNLPFIPFFLLLIAIAIIDTQCKKYLNKLEEQDDERNTF